MLKTARFTNQPDKPFGLAGVILRTALRALQLLVALVVTGMYGRDLHRASQAHEPADSRWVYAVVVAALSILATIVFLVPAVRSGRYFAGDGVLFVLWVAVFAVFARLYVGEDCEGSGACRRMKTAMWFDLVGMLLWFGSFVGGAFMFWRERHSHSIFTGRGTV